MKLDQLHARLQRVHAKGWIPSLRHGDTGVGFTLEKELGLSESNLEIADFGQVELKAKRKDSQTMLTLFTLDRNVWRVDQKELIRVFGTSGDDGRINLYRTLSATRPLSDLQLLAAESDIRIRSNDGAEVANWSLEALANRFNEKVRHTLVVTAESRKTEGKEQFKYVRAELVHGVVTQATLRYLFESGVMMIDIRMHLRKNGKVRNHGTAFRIPVSRFAAIFARNQELDLSRDAISIDLRDAL